MQGRDEVVPTALHGTGAVVAEEEEGGREAGQAPGVHHGEQSGAPAEVFSTPPIANLS